MPKPLRETGQAGLLPGHQVRGPADASRRPVQPLAVHLHLPVYPVLQTREGQAQRIQPDPLRLRTKLRRCGRRGGANIGTKIGNGEVRLVGSEMCIRDRAFSRLQNGVDRQMQAHSQRLDWAAARVSRPSHLSLIHI